MKTSTTHTITHKGKKYNYILKTYFSSEYQQEVLEISSEQLNFSELFDPADRERVIQEFLPEKITATLENNSLVMFPQWKNGECRPFYKIKLRNTLYPNFQTAQEEEMRKAISIRLQVGTINLLKQQAKEQGMPYQTMISSLLHQVAHKRISLSVQ